MKANELRVGNLVNYRFTDNNDERKEWNEPMVIDAEDIRVLTRKEYDTYSPIPLTEEWIKRLGCKEIYKGDYEVRYAVPGRRTFNRTKLFITIFFWVDGDIYVFVNGLSVKYVKYVHQLQNLYFALTGKELTINNLNK